MVHNLHKRATIQFGKLKQQ